MAVTLDAVAKAYNERRDKLDRLEKIHKESTEALKKEMAQLEAAAAMLLEKQGSTSSKTAHGTCFRSKWFGLKYTDWDAALDWIFENDRRDMLNKALSKTAILEEANAAKEAAGAAGDAVSTVPGVSIERGWKTTIRRPGGA